MAEMNSIVPITAMSDLKARIRGSVLFPGDQAYEEARHVWNGMIDRHPTVIVQCTGTADVIAAIQSARECGLPVSIRCGGHNVSGSAILEDGMVIDLSNMRAVHVDPEAMTVRVQGGARLGDIDHEAQAFNLAVPVGVVSATGIAGLALHGGMGFLTRKLGLTSDNLLSVDMVTADGTMLQVNEERHPDLLWAMKGGGGNCGVVTSMEFRLHPVGPMVWMGLVFYPAAAARWVLASFREIMANAPDELMAIAVLWNAPEAEPIPEEHRGAPVIILAGCWSGPIEEGEHALQALRDVATPIADLSGPMPYIAAQQLFDPEYPNGRRYYWKSIFLNHLNSDAIDLLTDYAVSRPSMLTSVDVWALGGAMNRVRPDATAFHERNAPFLVGIEANWEDRRDDEANIEWARSLFRAMRPFSSGGAYYNFPGFVEEGESLLKTSYGANYSRLQAIKAKYDPDNLFRSNMNIPVHP